MLEIKNQKTKTTACRENGRSADFTSGNFILGCSHKKEILMIIPALLLCSKIRQTKIVQSITQMSCWQSATKPYKTCLSRVPNQVDENTTTLTSLVIQILICIGTTMIDLCV
jgi:hypothetical protein